MFTVDVADGCCPEPVMEDVEGSRGSGDCVNDMRGRPICESDENCTRDVLPLVYPIATRFSTLGFGLQAKH